MLPDKEPTSENNKTNGIQTESKKLTNFEVIEACRQHPETGEVFSKLYAGDFSEYDRQEAFAELCGLLALQTDDNEQMKLIAKSSPLFEDIKNVPSEDEELSFANADKAGYALRVLTTEFLEMYSPVISIGDTLYVYDGGVYETDELVTSKARVFIQDKIAWDMHDVGISTQNADKVLRMVCDRVAVKACDVDNYPERLVVKNGILNVESGELFPHTHKELHTIKIDVTYDPAVQTVEAFNNFLKTTFYKVEWEIPIAQEILGYCLYKSYFIEKFFFLIGDGKGGKSVFLNLITRLLSKQNVTSMTLHDVCKPEDQFSLIGLMGKLASICGETGNDKIKNTGQLKRATGRDMIRSRHLYKNWVDFYNFAKLIFSMNNPPEIEDGTTGTKRRYMIIDFPNKFGKQKTDDFPNDDELERKLTTDESLTGILNWALQGLKRLLQNKEFSDQRSESQIAIEYEQKSNSMREFVREHIDELKGNKVQEHEIFEAYMYFAKLYKLPSLKRKDIRTKLIAECNAVDIEAKAGQNNGHDRTRFIKNIELFGVDNLKTQVNKLRNDHRMTDFSDYIDDHNYLYKNKELEPMLRDMITISKSKFHLIVPEIKEFTIEFLKACPGYGKTYELDTIVSCAEHLKARGWRI